MGAPARALLGAITGTVVALLALYLAEAVVLDLGERFKGTLVAIVLVVAAALGAALANELGRARP